MTETGADRETDAVPAVADAYMHHEDTDPSVDTEGGGAEARVEDTEAYTEPAASTSAMADVDSGPVEAGNVDVGTGGVGDVELGPAEAGDVDLGTGGVGDVDVETVEVGDVETEIAETEPANRIQQLEEEGDIAADYLEGLLDLADQDGDIDLDVEGDRASVSIVGDDLTILVGDNGTVLEALQELTRLAVYRETGERSRLMLDIGGFRADKRKTLESLARDAAEEVKESGEAVKLSPMTPFERKVVHDTVAEQGLRSESEGVEPARCVVVMPAE
jgi:spoIIIJ-associated protein